ncbi:hypothetical protein ACWPKO_08530 [Coraliomargarita sp. W4R53]
MKTLSTLLIALTALSFTSITHAESFAGKDSAHYYTNTPEQFDGEYVDVDCAFVTQINRGPQVEGVTFFTAHTNDKDNGLNGGTIVVAVLSDKADSFLRKYGDTPDIQRGSSEKVNSKRLRGIFHQLDKGHLYIDASEGEAHNFILAHVEEAKASIRSGSNASAKPGKPKVR